MSSVATCDKNCIIPKLNPQPGWPSKEEQKAIDKLCVKCMIQYYANKIAEEKKK